MIIVLELKLSTTVIAVIQFRRFSFRVVPLQSRKSRDTDMTQQTNIISLISGCTVFIWFPSRAVPFWKPQKFSSSHKLLSQLVFVLHLYSKQSSNNNIIISQHVTYAWLFAVRSSGHCCQFIVNTWNGYDIDFYLLPVSSVSGKKPDTSQKYWMFCQAAKRSAILLLCGDSIS